MLWSCDTLWVVLKITAMALLEIEQSSIPFGFSEVSLHSTWFLNLLCFLKMLEREKNMISWNFHAIKMQHWVTGAILQISQGYGTHWGATFLGEKFGVGVWRKWPTSREMKRSKPQKGWAVPEVTLHARELLVQRQSSSTV